MSHMSNFFGRIVMSYPFYIHAATYLTASQHPCRLFFAAAAVAAPFILISNSAYAALNCTTQPTCEQLVIPNPLMQIATTTSFALSIQAIKNA